MIRNLSILLATLAAAIAPAAAGPIERALEERWRGAWVVLEIETRSRCDSSYSNNRVNGRLSQGGGPELFEPGELARLDNLAVHRSRVDVRLSIPEPVRVAFRDGPFTLFERRSCKVELEIEVPRALVKARDIDGIDSYLRDVMASYATESEARDSDGYNARACQPFPDDYEETLHAWRIWKAEETNRQVSERLSRAGASLASLTDSFSQAPAYVNGFAAGVGRMRSRGMPSSCPTLLGSVPTPARQDPPGRFDTTQALRDEWRRGFDDGQRFVYLARLIGLLEGCYVEVPR